MKIKFYKYQGAGNDFILIDTIKTPDANHDYKNISIKACNRHYGVGADGLVVLSTKNEVITWDFYNSDGSFAAMCGNAARCVGLHLYREHHLHKADVITGAGSVSIQKQKEYFSVEMPKYKGFTQLESNVHFVDTGVPHVVVSIHKDEDMIPYIKEYRYHKIAGQHGANVSFYYQDQDMYHAKTFERGVEGFTLACGTGAAACGLVIAKQNTKSIVPIQMPGGLLRVEVKEETIHLIGSAEIICHGDLYV